MSVYSKAKLIAAGVDVSQWMRQMAYNESAEELDDTAMGDDTRTSCGGLLRWTIEARVQPSLRHVVA